MRATVRCQGLKLTNNHNEIVVVLAVVDRDNQILEQVLGAYAEDDMK